MRIAKGVLGGTIKGIVFLTYGVLKIGLLVVKVLAILFLFLLQLFLILIHAGTPD